MGDELDLRLGGARRTASPGRQTPTMGDAHARVLAARVVADDRPSALDRGAIALLQTVAGNGGVVRMLEDDAPERVRSVLSRSGEALDPGIAQDMSARLGADLSDVRIHRDAAASESARAVNAHAYTVGSDIVFQAGQYDPSSPAGQRTLAHELTHVVQQRAGAVEGTDVGGGLALSHPSDRSERDASMAAERLMAGGASAPTPTRPTTPRDMTGDDGSIAQRDGLHEPLGDDDALSEEGGSGLPAQREADDEDEEGPA